MESLSCVVDLKYLLINSDIESINECLLQELISCGEIAKGIQLLGYLGKFNPTDDLIEYLVNTGSTHIINSLIDVFSYTCNINMFSIMLPYITNIKDFLTKLIDKYSGNNSFTYKKLCIKKFLLLTLDKLKDSITILDIHDIMYNKIYKVKYIANDAILYIMFRFTLINDLSIVPTKILIKLAKFSVSNNASTSLLDTLLKYIPTDAINDIYNSKFIPKPDDYISLFEEDV